MSTPPAPAAVPPTPTPAPTANDDEPKEYKPSPKVAVVIAGAALAVTTGLTLLIIPYVRQASKISTPPQFLSHALRARTLRPNVPRPFEEAAFHEPLPRVAAANVETARLLAKAKEASMARSAESVDTASEASPSLLGTPVEEIEHELDEPRAAPVDPRLSREFNDAEEDYHYGKPEYDEGGAPVQHVSPWLGFQALGIATAIVLGSAGLGVWGAAKYLGVSSMEEFAQKMRGSLESTAPELVENVRRESDEPAPDAPDLLDKHGIDIDDNKLRSWVKSWGYGDENK